MIDISQISDLSKINNSICKIVSQKSICRKLHDCDCLEPGALSIYDVIRDKKYKYYNDCKVLCRSTRSSRIVLPMFKISTYKEIDITNKYCMMINDDIEVSKFMEFRMNKFECLMGE